MPIVLKTSLTVLLLVVFSVVLAGAADEASQEGAFSSLRETGHVEGYMSLPVGDTAVDATFIRDKLGTAYGKLLILHDSDGGIDSRDIVHTIRTALPEAGWSTMTVALEFDITPQIYPSPTESTQSTSATANSDEQTEQPAESKAAPDETPQQEMENTNASRVSTALAYLNAQQPGPTVVMALGATAELGNIVVGQLGEQRGLIWVRPDMPLSEPPDVDFILDIAADSVGVKNEQAQSRRVLMRRNNMTGYSQRLITGADHQFSGFEQTVLTYVRAWLNRHFVSGVNS